ncbi:MAG: ABC transporter ATP-binding protein [Bacillota bacterium]|nr:ABC transporter ATP-binding protein [Bacillota bacterium]
MEQFQEKQLETTWDWQLLKKLMKYTKPWWGLLLLAVLLLFLATANYLYKPAIIKSIVDDYLVVGATAESLPAIYKLVAMLGGLVLLTLVASYIQTFVLSYVGQKVVYSIRSDLFEKLLTLDLRFYEKNPVGRLVTRMTNDLNNISQLYTNVLVTTLSDFAIVVGCLVMMAVMDLRLTLISMSVLPILIISTVFFRYKIRAAYRNVRVRLAKINATLNENIMGMKTIQVFNQEKKFDEAFCAINDDYRAASKREIYLYAIFRPFVNFLYYLTLIIALVFGGIFLLQGKIEIGVIIAFTIYIKLFYRPILELAEKFNILQSALTSIERVFLLFEEPERILNDSDYRPERLQGHVEFKGVRFAYNPDEPVLKGIDFEVRPEETVAFVGATGSGKSTIINLLTRLYDIDDGEIRIDGRNIREYDKYYLRERIIPVLQDVFLFSGTIRDNIALLGDHYTDEQIWDALRFVNADRFVRRFPDGLDHVVTEGGATLSQGERQLLSFARAILRDPDILILDEATSSIDTETEMAIQEAIEKVSRQRTTFVVAHRLSTIKKADHIVVIHKGEIREVGRHDELIAAKGIYYDLYRLQEKEVRSTKRTRSTGDDPAVPTTPVSPQLNQTAGGGSL